MRCLVGDAIRTWDSRVPQAEFAHNNAFNRSLGFFPFQVVYGIVPRGLVALSNLPDRTRLHGDAATFVDSLAHIHDQAVANLESSTTKYKESADLHRHKLVFEVGNLVWAYLTKDRMPSHAYNKLKAKKIGPLQVLERINDNAYRLQLPANISTSDVFNVKYLSRYLGTPTVPDSGSNPSHPGSPDAAASMKVAPTSV